ncbi:MAG: sigma-E processing peptidase SpoIIGA, partial [Defluviitaleaceae bacterium]|nr:sigma-E processing peptidase SpoIIGA [Defluviitaleaceae bacterium]
MEIYADIVFAVNFFMDLFILWGAGQFMGKKLRPIWLSAAAFVMALLYVLFIVFVPHSIVANILASILLITLGVYIAFRPKHIKELVQLVGFSYIFAFAVGGFGLALFSF